MHRLSFMIGIVALFATFTFMLSMFLFWNFYQRGLTQAYTLINEKNTQAMDSIAKSVTLSIDKVTMHLSVLLHTSHAFDVVLQKDATLKLMWEQLKSDSSISSIFLADEYGTFLQARREPELATRVIDKQQSDIWTLRESNYKIKEEVEKELTYDPRSRGWYKEAQNDGKFYYSEPYLFASTGAPGVTIALPYIDGEKRKVAAADFTLHSISAILDKMSDLLGGEMLMINRSGDIIGASFPIEESSTSLPNIKNLGVSRYIEVAQDLKKMANGEVFERDGEEYIYFISQMPTQKEWYILSFIKKSTVLEDINHTLFITIAISSLIIFVLYFLMHYLLRQFFILPIKELKNQTELISQSKFNDVKVIGSKIVEFYELSLSMKKMAESIDAYKENQKRLVDSFIKIVAESIDAKSPYTGSHCERVPILATMIAKEASKSRDGIFSDFTLSSKEELREFEVAAWLHDCGKVVTPEYVVDKATKLETIYNRIHEIRMRFEVLYRDALIEYHKSLFENPNKKEEYKRALEERYAKLKEDFAFIAECNVGEVFMDEERVGRVEELSKVTWKRYFDNRAGLSHLELLRLEEEGRESSDIEYLLQDRLEHKIKREREIDKIEYQKYGITMDIPLYAYNHGEITNLCIKRGTLNNEERFKINEHVIMTIKMLESIPFTDDLKRVPEYAGAHHETMIGSGYPRGLKRDEISIAGRVMAIADIFEALTACDRPYKKAKTLSQSIKIMSFMAKDGHIDRDIFALFLRSGIYLEYAKEHLKNDQIDSVDIEAILEKL